MDRDSANHDAARRAAFGLSRQSARFQQTPRRNLRHHFGGIGVHKFILGYTGAGIIMLLVSVLSCGTLYPIMHLIGLIEGIVYLAKSDDEFVRTYVDGRKEWF